MCRQFYRVFPIANALCSQFNWTHYRTLIRIDNQDKRDFYIAEAIIASKYQSRNLDKLELQILLTRLRVKKMKKEGVKPAANPAKGIQFPTMEEINLWKHESRDYEFSLRFLIDSDVFSVPGLLLK